MWFKKPQKEVSGCAMLSTTTTLYKEESDDRELGILFDEGIPTDCTGSPEHVVNCCPVSETIAHDQQAVHPENQPISPSINSDHDWAHCSKEKSAF